MWRHWIQKLFDWSRRMTDDDCQRVGMTQVRQLRHVADRMEHEINRDKQHEQAARGVELPIQGRARS